jgi:hypothetical protein
MPHTKLPRISLYIISFKTKSLHNLLLFLYCYYCIRHRYNYVQPLTLILPLFSGCTVLLTYPALPATMPSSTIANFPPKPIHNLRINLCVSVALHRPMPPPRLFLILVFTLPKHPADCTPLTKLVHLLPHPLPLSAMPLFLFYLLPHSVAALIAASRLNIAAYYPLAVEIPTYQSPATPAISNKCIYRLYVDIIALLLKPLFYLPLRHQYHRIYYLAFSSSTSTLLRKVSHAPRHPYMQDIHHTRDIYPSAQR